MSSIDIASGIFKVGEHTEALKPTEYVMAVSVYPDTLAQTGIARVIKNRQGDVAIPGFIDHSELHEVVRVNPGKWEIGAPLNISGLEELVNKIKPDGTEFIGLEDPDIVAPTGDSVHLYFTIPFIGHENYIFLGHAEGDMSKLEMQSPVLRPFRDNSEEEPYIRGFKELCPSPADSAGVSHHLVESNSLRNSISYSTIAVVNTRTPGGSWEFVGDVIHPAELREKYADYARSDEAYEWCGEHVSPCRLLPTNIADLGKYRVGILNGREKSSSGVYGKFRPGLFLYDTESGSVPWVDPLPLFDDPDARTIIFASDLVVNEGVEGSEKSITLMTHVDDSYIQNYIINASTITGRIPAHLSGIA